MSDKKISVSSSAHVLKDEKAKVQEKELEELKKKAEQDEKKAKEKQKTHKVQQKKVDKKQEQKKAQVEKAATSVGTALAAEALKGFSSKNGKKRGLIFAGILVIGILGYLFFGNQIKHMLGIDGGGGVLPSSFSELLPDSQMGYNHIDFSNAILGEAREKQELIVLEQDVQVDSEISNALANISLFKKTKLIHSYGTGVYTVDMKQIDEDHIVTDEEKKTVTVEIPHTVLQYVNIDIDKTEFEKTDKAILGFGDIKMTQEQQKILSQSIDDAMRKELDTQSMYNKADEVAVLKVREVFQPLISSVSEEYIVKIVQK